MDFQPAPRSENARRAFVREALAGALQVAPAEQALRLVHLAAAASDFGRVTMGCNWWDAPEGDRGHYLLCHLRRDSTAPQGVRLHCDKHGKFSGPAASMRWALANRPQVPPLPGSDREWLAQTIAELLTAPRQ